MSSYTTTRNLRELTKKERDSYKGVGGSDWCPNAVFMAHKSPEDKTLTEYSANDAYGYKDALDETGKSVRTDPLLDGLPFGCRVMPGKAHTRDGGYWTYLSEEEFAKYSHYLPQVIEKLNLLNVPQEPLFLN